METSVQAAQGSLSITKLISEADPVVQGVMIGLALASVLCWAIGLEKLLRFAGFSAQLKRIEKHHSPIEDGWLVQRFKVAAGNEPLLHGEHRVEYETRLERALGQESRRELRRLQSGLALLATVGSTAPFVGLFGTVWGIMNSFTGIAAAKDTSLAVVAPGIAEALLATAMGLVAAIPAVIFYNLANVFLTNSAERLASAGTSYAKAAAEAAFEHDRVNSLKTISANDRVVANGGIGIR